MNVNSVLRYLFNNRKTWLYGVATIVFTVFVLAAFLAKPTNRNRQAMQANLAVRQIGHQLLLQSGDSTSSILPVMELEEGTFLLEFQQDLVFSHDSLIGLSQSLLSNRQFPSGYTVSVNECTNAMMVYGFQVSRDKTPSILPCVGRSQAPGCYTMEFFFPHLYTHPYNYPLIGLAGGGALLLLGIGMLIGRVGKNPVLAPEENANQSTKTTPAEEVIALGDFLFDKKKQHLLLGSKVIDLTDKECRILELLTQNLGELIPRQTFMEEVWINEGLITGRSLDMFISKLRKKLSSDPLLNITNVHGKGYKLEHDGG
ncbi:MAG: winged helix-turn-helix domain-containing protein [Marinoscillum sp.]